MSGQPRKVDPTIPPAALKDPVILLATGFGAGLLRPAPGTWGTVAALPLIGLLLWMPLWLAWPLLLLLCLVGIPLCSAAGERLGVSDHGGIVYDEIAGWALTVLLLAWLESSLDAFGPLTLLASFLAFRFFDIVKPWPVSWADRAAGGGLGVMLDDLLAALYAAATVALLAQGIATWWPEA